jgi:hypothetical protein
MSTKTTFKRVALVAVASLGFGVLTSVAPASAADALAATATGKTTSVSAAVAGKALRVGVQSRISVTYTGPAITAYSNDSGTSFTGGWAAGETVNPNMRVLSVPATSAVAITPASSTNSVTSGVGLDIDNYTNRAAGTSTTYQQVGEGITLGAQAEAAFAAIDFTPDKAGSYSFLFWDDVNRDGALGGATEKYVVATFVVGNEIASLTASTVINNGTTIGTSYSSVVKVVAKDAAGNATVPSGADSVTLTVTGSAKWKYSFGGPSNSTTEVSGAGTNTAYLTATDFDSKGAAYIGLYDNVAETVSVTPGGTSDAAR